MATAKDIERLLAKITKISEHEIDWRVRPLREKGYLPVGGRGRFAPPIDAFQAALIILCLCARKAADAAPLALEIRKYVCNDVGGGVTKDLHSFIRDHLVGEDKRIANLYISEEEKYVRITFKVDTAPQGPKNDLIFSENNYLHALECDNYQTVFDRGVNIGSPLMDAVAALLTVDILGHIRDVNTIEISNNAQTGERLFNGKSKAEIDSLLEAVKKTSHKPRGKK